MILKKAISSIAFRISVSIAAVVAATTIGIGYLILIEQRNMLELELHDKGINLIHIIAHHVTEPLLYEERHIIYSVLNASMIDKESLVVYAEVYDKNGKLTVSAFNSKKVQKKKLQPLNFEAFVNGLDIQDDSDLQLHHVSIPIDTETLGTIGYIRLGITNEFLHSTLKKAKHNIYLFCAAVIFIGIIFGLWMARKILRPILVLNKGVHMIGEGDVGVEIPLVGEGEIKELAQSFNNMSRKLKELFDATKAAQENLIRTEKLYAIGEFSAGVAHEIQNPLTSIKMLMQTVAHKKQALSDKDFEVVEGEINRIDRIIKEFIAFARPKKLEKSHLNINDVLEDVILITKPKMKQSRIFLEQTFSSDLPVINGNNDALKQVFLNIVLNALQAMEEGGTLIVETSVDDNKVLVVINDTGIGILQENLKKIFDPFFTTKDEGTGMGLALTYAIVNEHSGKIDIKSKPWVGTTVTVELPLL
ncbi:MAG: HAMP domain-containing protein [Nitrospirae bacterium]|nr:HAMP domain-containing protein [Nitrospirota bacterium]